MNLVITKSEEMDFPNFETCLYTNCKARIAEFNRFGTLLAIGCKYGMVLIMDFTSKEVVRIFDYFGNTNLQFNNEITNFTQFSNGDYSQIYDLFEHEQTQGAKKVTKIPSPREKEREQINISAINWSYDSNYILVSYQLVNTIVLWNVETCEKQYQVAIPDPTFLHAQLYPYNANIAVISCGNPYVVDMKSKEVVKLLSPSHHTLAAARAEEQKASMEESKKSHEHHEDILSEEWLILALSQHNAHYFLLIDPHNRLVLVKEKTKAMEDIDSDHEDAAPPEISEMINTSKFSVVASLPLAVNGRITSVTCDDTQKYILVNATDRCLRLIKVSYSRRLMQFQKECVDVINRKKWMTAGFFTTRHPTKERYVVSGVGESGSHEICFISMEKGSVERRLGPSKEGCLHLCGHHMYHNSIVVVTSNGDLLLWSVKNPKSWTALAPEFTEIDENVEYIEKEEEFDAHNMIYVTPTTDPHEVVPIDKKSDYFDVKEDTDMYVHYSTFDIFEQSSSYLPQSNLLVVKPGIKPDFLTLKGKSDVRKLKERMETKGITLTKCVEGGSIEVPPQ